MVAVAASAHALDAMYGRAIFRSAVARPRGGTALAALASRLTDRDRQTARSITSKST
jgi:hypothetical protein